MELKSKKGIQLNQAVGAIVTLVLLGVLVIIGIYMFVSIGASTIPTGSSTWGVNENVVITTAGTSMLGDSVLGSTCGTVTVRNSTYSLNSGNYTQTNCVLANATSMAPYGTTLIVNYSYSSPTTSAATVTVTNFSGYPALVGLVGTIIFLALVIGVLVASFVFGGRKNEA